MLLVTNKLDLNKPQKISFGNKIQSITSSFSKTTSRDICNIENIKKIICHPDGELKRIIYSKPQSVLTAFTILLQTKNEFIKEELKEYFHSDAEIQGVINDFKKMPQIANLNVISLYGLGATAFAFELAEGNILKITQYNHFPDDREPADFDAPIYEKGKIGENTYYYIEEKLFQANIEQDEIKELCDYIESQGYELRDIKDIRTGKYLERQFGKDEKGNLYLCDPGCARLKEEKLPIFKRIKRAIFELIGMMMDDIT